MSAAIIAVVVVIAVVVIVAGVMVSRHQRIQRRFGPEYTRVADELKSQLKADAEFADRERRVRQFHIQPLPEIGRTKYLAEWTAVQERFVDQPEQAVREAQRLVVTVMEKRGYPTEGYDQALADLSVEHAGTLDRLRAAHDVSERAIAGTASTEDLREAMINYRALFSELLGQPSEPPAEPGEDAAPPTPDAPTPPPRNRRGAGRHVRGAVPPDQAADVPGPRDSQPSDTREEATR